MYQSCRDNHTNSKLFQENESETFYIFSCPLDKANGQQYSNTTCDKDGKKCTNSERYVALPLYSFTKPRIIVIDAMLNTCMKMAIQIFRGNMRGGYFAAI